MTRWQHFLAAFEIRHSKIEIVFVRPDQLSPEKIDAILRETGKETPLFRAVLQMLEETRDEAIANVAEVAAMPAMDAVAMAKHAGGAEYLRAVRDDLVRRQAAGGEGRGKTPNAQLPTPNVQ